MATKSQQYSHFFCCGGNVTNQTLGYTVSKHKYMILSYKVDKMNAQWNYSSTCSTSEDAKQIIMKAGIQSPQKRLQSILYFDMYQSY
jgi:hypothetical protein